MAPRKQTKESLHAAQMGARMRSRRYALGLSGAAVAELLPAEVPEWRYLEWERGRAVPPLYIGMLVAILDTTYDDLLYDGAVHVRVPRHPRNSIRDRRKRVQALYADGLTVPQIAEALNVPYIVAYRDCRICGLDVHRGKAKSERRALVAEYMRRGTSVARMAQMLNVHRTTIYEDIAAIEGGCAESNAD